VAFGITEPLNGKPATAANGATIGFKCDSTEQVHAFHAAAIAHGGEAIEDPPGLRGNGPLYLAYARDPDGNKLCAAYRQK
jgi:catechol 2,3-dioxygenase-like lactoylglutathione lyase family enzyme